MTYDCIVKGTNNTNWETTMKTWTELCGKRQDGDHVAGRYWVRPTGHGRFVLWTFDTEQQARECFLWWK